MDVNMFQFGFLLCDSLWLPRGLLQLIKRVEARGFISPLLFLPAAEGLGEMLFREAEARLIEGFQVGNENLRVSHLQYTTDILIMCRNS